MGLLQPPAWLPDGPFPGNLSGFNYDLFILPHLCQLLELRSGSFASVLSQPAHTTVGSVHLPNVGLFSNGK